MIEIAREAKEQPDLVKSAPHRTVVGRMDRPAPPLRPRLRWTADTPPE
ncbi:MAG: hypothetical protein R3F14_25615 [Polyangiaceae bacterium]